ncbi:TMhelix containing protein [Vibrio phage 1.249.A._10N.261.55.B9]|uniref:TMhelix containing protein n=2 Tax=Autolykiviridae TaxID=2184034 RepID=A0A2I7RXE5_9VIRU|nr:TMhelix containing protein [Vibrio phage 1.249.A._10N.261.55.B9]AUR98316.1 TMhelix containing protein [Vibrio phage 1.249.A._10N.261.55.B9]AUR98338.1 TMhelix containing protein [Vibrio phage 1.249.B._10N.261.55.B9]
MKKYIPYLLAGIAGGIVVKYMADKKDLDTTAKRPEQDTAANWWKFW